MSLEQDWRGPYTVDDLADLSRFPPEEGVWELEEGWPAVSPWRGVHVAAALDTLRDLLYTATREADLHVGMIRIEIPGGTSRVPDLVVVDGQARRAGRRARAKSMGAGDVVLAVEFVSLAIAAPVYVTKRREYARSGIPYYWIVDLEPVPAITALTLHGTEYALQAKAEGDDELVVEKPFAIRFSPARLAAD
ncbi:Uma2 family endonuclease [Nonomuraea typhae]|uniref:Uma2 family endonuclease n=1 Tax=Nonomuraea typhae TaxID=2603600 RepID=A0ABW7Z8N8_9ACTN